MRGGDRDLPGRPLRERGSILCAHGAQATVTVFFKKNPLSPPVRLCEPREEGRKGGREEERKGGRKNGFRIRIIRINQMLSD